MMGSGKRGPGVRVNSSVPSSLVPGRLPVPSVISTPRLLFFPAPDLDHPGRERLQQLPGWTEATLGVFFSFSPFIFLAVL